MRPTADLISAIEFDETGDCLAIGDRGGRIVILKKAEAEKVRGFRGCFCSRTTAASISDASDGLRR